MKRRVRRLLWRFGCGLVTEDRLAEALEHYCRHLFDQCFAHPAVRSEPLSESTAALTRLDEFESTLALARSHTRAHRFRKAYQALLTAESDLQQAFRILEASAELEAVLEIWRQAMADLDLAPLRDFISLRSMQSMFRVGKRCLVEGEAEKAQVVVLLARHRVTELLAANGDEERRTRLDERLNRVRKEMDIPVVKGLHRILGQHFLELGSRLLDDWEIRDPTELEARVDSKPPALFEELLHRSQNLSAQLARLGEGEN